MDNAHLIELAQQWANDILVWVGFGTLVGLLAELIMPGHYRGGAIATLCMGIGGTVIGCGVVAFFTGGNRITPITFTGFLVSTAGAFVLLFFYRLLGGYFIREGSGNTPYGVRRPFAFWRWRSARSRQYAQHD